MAEKSERHVVPCGACRVCCLLSWVFLDPKRGDVAELYDTVDVIHPITGAPAKALAHQPNGGGCIYLGPSGCTIHERAPSLCRDFDCRVYYAQTMAKPRTIRKRELSDFYSARELFDAGRDLRRAHPLPSLRGTADETVAKRPGRKPT